MEQIPQIHACFFFWVEFLFYLDDNIQAKPATARMRILNKIIHEIKKKKNQLLLNETKFSVSQEFQIVSITKIFPIKKV